MQRLNLSKGRKNVFKLLADHINLVTGMHVSKYFVFTADKQNNSARCKKEDKTGEGYSSRDMANSERNM